MASSSAQSMLRTDTDELSVNDFGLTGGAHEGPRITVTNVGGTEERAKASHAKLAAKKPYDRMSKVLRNRPPFTPVGVVVRVSEYKDGIMPNIDDVLDDIAAQAGLSMDDAAQYSELLTAITSDLILNPYSDKKRFDRSVPMGAGYLDLQYVKEAISPHVGLNNRQFARAFAPIAQRVMLGNPDFHEALDFICSVKGFSTRAEAAASFDGADALILDRRAAQYNALLKKIALERRDGPRAYRVENTAPAFNASGAEGHFESA